MSPGMDQNKELFPASLSQPTPEEIEVIITEEQVLFSWNSAGISELAHMLGKPELDRVPCG